MPADTPPLRLLVGIGLRLAIRSFCTTTQAGAPFPNITFGVSQTFKRMIAEGQGTDLLLTDDIAVARSLAHGPAPVWVFGSDTLLAASRPEIRLNSANFLQRLLEDPVRIAIAIPGVNEGATMADHFWALCDQDTPGAGQILRDKARLIQGPQALSWGPRQVMELLGGGEADVALGPRSMLRSLSAVADLVAPPPPLAVDVACGLTILATTHEQQQAAQAFADRLMSDTGQAVLTRHGFASASRAAAMV